MLIPFAIKSHIVIFTLYYTTIFPISCNYFSFFSHKVNIKEKGLFKRKLEITAKGAAAVQKYM